MRTNLKDIPEEPQYVEAKLSSAEFQEAKKFLFQVNLLVALVFLGLRASQVLIEIIHFQAFKKAELGSWVEKPMEQDEFETKAT